MTTPTQPTQPEQKPKTRASLVALVGTACAATLCSYVPQFEGMILRGYTDPIGIVTACAGHTRTAVLGKPYTQAECESMLVMDLIDHAEPVLKCTPQLQGRPHQLAAATSFAFNVGTNAYCHSTMAKRFRAGDYAAGCAEFSKWIHAGGKVLPGLVTRRKVERALCEGRLDGQPAANDEQAFNWRWAA